MFRFLLIVTVFLHTIPALACIIRLQWPLPPLFDLESVCKSNIVGKTFSPVDTPPAPIIVRNFAHFGDGARVLPEITSLTHGTKDNSWLHASPLARDFVYKNPPYIISDDQMTIGACWEMERSTGTLGILLSEPTRISSVSIDNIPPHLVSVASSRRNPRTVALWGMLPNSSITIPAAVEVRRAKQFLPNFAPGSRSLVKGKDIFVLLLSTHYDPWGATTNQLFELAADHWAAQMVFQSVVVEISENWGGDTTCLYRLRVHGHV